jgi:hypothetical protein
MLTEIECFPNVSKLIEQKVFGRMGYLTYLKWRSRFISRPCLGCLVESDRLAALLSVYLYVMSPHYPASLLSYHKSTLPFLEFIDLL